MTYQDLSRRAFLAIAASAGVGCSSLRAWHTRTTKRIPDDAVRVACVGCGGMGLGDMGGIRAHGGHIVAMCDVDWAHAAGAIKEFPDINRYSDFRRMLDREHKHIDAVTISTPDHSHALIALHAMALGKHVYVQKPAASTVQEAQWMLDASRRFGVATQMGNQGHAMEGARRLCEIIWAGTIGEIREVHCWTNRPIWPQGITQPLAEQPVPSSLDWPLWLAATPYRPYNEGYCPFKWRGWWDFGCGALGDMGCHILDGPYWALNLGAPDSVECLSETGCNVQTGPTQAVIRYQFPERLVDGKTWPSVTLTWHEGGALPPWPDALPAEPERYFGDGGAMLVGTDGVITCDNMSGSLRLWPLAKFKGKSFPEPYLPRTNGTHADWLSACRGEGVACSNFEYSIPLTKTVLLGNAAIRVGADCRLDWNDSTQEFTNVPEANRFLVRTLKSGWFDKLI